MSGHLWLLTHCSSSEELYVEPGKEPAEWEVRLYTWRDATLWELTELLQEVFEPARDRGAKLDFGLVYPNRDGRFKLRRIGEVVVGSPRPSDRRTLAEATFEPGDFLDVVVR